MQSTSSGAPRVDVIGAGIVGLASALELSDAGCSVRVFERGEVAREASWAGGGLLLPLHAWTGSEALWPLVAAGMAMHERLAQRLQSATGIDPEWTQSGLLVRAGAHAAPDAVLAWAARHGLAASALDAPGTLALEPAAGAHAATWLPGIAQVRNPRLARALAVLLGRRGVAVHTGEPVEEVRTDGGWVRGVTTPRARYDSDVVVVAGGAWTTNILAPFGDTAIVPVRGQMLLARTAPGAVRRMVLGSEHYVVPRRDGHLLCGSTVEYVGFDKAVTEEARAVLDAALHDLLPGLGAFECIDHWAGLRPASADGLPRIGAHPEVAGLYVNAGHFRNGLLLAPPSARLLADLVLGRPPCVDPAPYATRTTPPGRGRVH